MDIKIIQLIIYIQIRNKKQTCVRPYYAHEYERTLCGAEIMFII